MCTQCSKTSLVIAGELYRDLKELLDAAPYKIKNDKEREVTDRFDAARRGFLFYYDPKGCNRGHADVLRYTLSAICRKCQATITKASQDRKSKQVVMIDAKSASPTLILDL
jgi:hypothetical protein